MPMLERWVTHANTRWGMGTTHHGCVLLKPGAEFSTAVLEITMFEKSRVQWFWGSPRLGLREFKCYTLKMQWEMLILILPLSFNCHILRGFEVLPF